MYYFAKLLFQGWSDSLTEALLSEGFAETVYPVPIVSIHSALFDALLSDTHALSREQIGGLCLALVPSL